jgi:uncharacterized membrane protein
MCLSFFLIAMAKLREEMNGHKTGRTTLTTTEWEQSGLGLGPVPLDIFAILPFILIAGLE